jgi:hypothetical protein
MRFLPIILGLLLTVGCTQRDKGRVVVTPDTRPSFVLDGSKPFVIELGRGSGRRGIEIIRITEAGVVQVDRFQPAIESALIQLTPAQLKGVVDEVNLRQLPGMGRSYSDPGIMDGTQWILWISQGSFEKAVYFNNSFPDQITGFAGKLDVLLGSAGLSSAKASPVPRKVNEARQKALWSRIE